ncbi:hypothetical protein M2480_002052 [Parabacteroides sp. PFB2-12]|uniref:hypothetical protein n=1 Tax=unclassified Parabacteroides TaxID=2649774 RepID=UPI0024730123|nr:MULTISPECIES: hypothetical protein [unclassified Parabacteroides]MDH6342922.1 hypothetical protein [Parabacteroides sp. PM6-13]MDH6391063.1 hypothetical protein [Parabacteroides sp. PFB2-12]
MTTTSKISKRAVMIRAWNIYRRGSYSKNFGECLSRAWWVEKETIIYNAKQAAIEAEKERLAKWHASDEYKALCAQPRKVDLYDYYHGEGSRYRYFGD